MVRSERLRSEKYDQRPFVSEKSDQRYLGSGKSDQSVRLENLIRQKFGPDLNLGETAFDS